jgi:predicted GIY-YIG superfamily endonuclease
MAGHFTKFNKDYLCASASNGALSLSKGLAMNFHTYILLCADDSLYVGHTHDLSSRVDAHGAGRGALHTAKHGVAKLIYSEEYTTEKLAIARELQIKKWSRAKKMALINGDLERLRKLSRSRDT